MELPWRNTNIPARVQAPVTFLYFISDGDLAKARYIAVAAIRKRLGHSGAAAYVGFNPFATPEPYDVANEFDVIWVEHTVGPCDLTKQLPCIDEQYLIAS